MPWTCEAMGVGCLGPVRPWGLGAVAVTWHSVMNGVAAGYTMTYEL